MPAFTSGDSATICLNGAIPDGTNVDVSVGQKSASIVQVASTSVVAMLPEVSTTSDAVLTVRVNGTALPTPAPILIRQYAAADPVVDSVSPNIVTRGNSVRITGEGLAAPAKQVRVMAGEEAATVERVAADGTWIVVTIPSNPQKMGGLKPLSVTVWGIPARPLNRPLAITVHQPVSDAQTWTIGALSAIPTAIIAALVLGLYAMWQRRAARRPSQPPPNVLGGLLVEPQTNTYSLSRAQFYWWLLIIAYAYTFLFVGHALVEGNWSFPPLGTFAYTFLISLGTLALAQVTAGLKGHKGSGMANPSVSDLVMHGGVVAPERVQQLLWSVIGGLAFVGIVIATYHSATTLPEVPTELLTLMGLSGIAYVGGKALRAPGPNIKQVNRGANRDGQAGLVINGDNLAPNARVWIDDHEVPIDKVQPKRDQRDGQFV